ncbi:MAG: bi-domain-containing oxidoreductase [Syntrophaceae bacterium]|nr:bi-domain-containing oxidoreductase [Syntrophaceae bacterium]
MKQILQNLKNGATELMDVPNPLCGAGRVLIRSTRSLVSAGTERMLVDFGKAGWIEKARSQPDKVKQVLDKIRTDGLLPTVEAVFNKLDEPLPLGYCNTGVVLQVGSGITDLQPGDRVASNGPHAEVVCVPRNLCAKVPDEVSDDAACFTVLGSIALQGIRLAMPTLGERFMVFGMGLLGLLTVQLLRANGCSVLAVDVSEKRLKLADSFGAETVDLGKGADPVTAALAWAGSRGVDRVLITASAKGDEIVHQAAQACRKRGRIVLVGVVDLNLRRSDFYDKELSFQVSCSYGPGRYDEKYEQAGQDYPLGFVRWTEQRNFEAVLEAMRTGQLQVQGLITHHFALDEASGVYEKVLHEPDALGIVLEYPNESNEGVYRPNTDYTSRAVHEMDSRLRGNDERKYWNDRVNVGVIGAGGFARSILLPALSRTKANLVSVADINGVFAAQAVRKFGTGEAVSDYRRVLDDPVIQAVFILVGHQLHARFVCEALEAGKHVFVEKPLALNEAELRQVEDAAVRASDRLVMVGFNRRFSSHVVKMKQVLAGRAEPLCMNMTVNAGFIPTEHWVQDPLRGGGRIIGEGCHFIDLLSFIAGQPVASVSAMMVGGNGAIREDKMSILLGFADGSLGTVNYFANGSKSYPKETLEVFGDGKVIRMDNFLVTRGYGFKGFPSFRTWRQDKGHRAEVAAFVERVATGGEQLIPFNEMANVTRASFAAVYSADMSKTIKL